jgi:predicted MarR family transcription regulator
MKQRNGFVSNSSTSSFVCGVCGGIESDRDLSLRDCEMFECENGHNIHQACVKLLEEGEAELAEDFQDALANDRYSVNSKFCPVCQLKAVQDVDIIKYLLRKVGTTEEVIVKEIQDKYSSLEALDKDLWPEEK